MGETPEARLALQAWIDRRVEWDPLYRCRTWDLYRAYVAEVGPDLSAATFGIALTLRGAGKLKKPVGTVRTGCRLKEAKP